MVEIVAATGNPGKLSEIKTILSDLDVTLTSLKDYPGIENLPEEGDTFEENARQKALLVARKTGKIALADDSGISVDSLGGLPGVRSARFAGEDVTDLKNNLKLLKKLEGVPDGNRSAAFICCIAISKPDGNTRILRGECRGIILREFKGKNGFVYDPIFFHPPSGKTLAEMGADEKNLISHRGIALRKLKKILPAFIGE